MEPSLTAIESSVSATEHRLALAIQECLKAIVLLGDRLTTLEAKLGKLALAIERIERMG